MKLVTCLYEQTFCCVILASALVRSSYICLNHIVWAFSAMMKARYSIIGSYLIDITELQQVQPHTLLRFAKASKRFIKPFGYLWAAHWAETDYGLSAGQHPVLPEGKGKGKDPVGAKMPIFN